MLLLESGPTPPPKEKNNRAGNESSAEELGIQIARMRTHANRHTHTHAPVDIPPPDLSWGRQKQDGYSQAGDMQMHGDLQIAPTLARNLHSTRHHV